MQPLSDIRVLAVTVFLAGPFLSTTLARFGAEVIKVEIPDIGDSVRGIGPFAGPEGVNRDRRTDKDISTKFLKRTQGVKSVTLNLKDPAGRKLFLDLARKSDVIVENLAPGSMTRLGLGYDDVAAVNPRIVYCSISGYGQSGPYADDPAHDHQIQAMAGMMDVNGEPGGDARRMGIFASDLVTPLYAAYSILAALRHREQTGEGQYLDASMMDSLATLMFMEPLEEAVANDLPIRAGNDSRTGPTGLYSTRDGDLIVTAASAGQWAALCEALEAPELFADERFADSAGRVENLPALRREIQDRIGRLSAAEAIERMKAADVPVAPVRSLPDVLADDHLYRRGTLKPMQHGVLNQPVEGGVVVGFPILFSGEQLPDLPGAPSLGMHNDEIFREILGLDDERIRDLKDRGTI